MLVLSRDDLARLLPPADVIEAVAAGFRAYAAGTCTVPARATVRVGDGGTLLLMPAVAHAEALGTNLVSV